MTPSGASLTVTNTGARTGTDTPQFYLGLPQTDPNTGAWRRAATP